MKKLMLLLVALGASAFTKAETFNVLRVYYADGTTADEALSDLRSITCSEGTLMMNYTNGGAHAYEMADVNMLSFEYETLSPVEPITAQDNEVSVTIWGETVTIISTGSTAAQWYLYGMDGRLYRHGKASGTVEFGFDGLNHGVYVLKVNGSTYKMIKR